MKAYLKCLDCKWEYREEPTDQGYVAIAQEHMNYTLSYSLYRHKINLHYCNDKGWHTWGIGWEFPN